MADPIPPGFHYCKETIEHEMTMLFVVPMGRAILLFTNLSRGSKKKFGLALGVT